MPEKNDRYYCMLPMPGPALGRPRAAVLNEFKWQPGSRVGVGFMAGDPSLRERVSRVAAEWTGPRMANLRLEWVDDGDADIRIAFEQGDCSWSYLGTVCQQIDAGEPTMNYGWLTPDSSEQDVRRVVLHEFGHALGLIHEHPSPSRPIAWNRATVIADVSGPPNNWDEGTIESNIFTLYEAERLSSTPVDPFSIMMYPIPAAWTTDGFSAGLNRELSETDKAFIRNAYPW